MYFTLEFESEVIRDAFSQELMRTLVYKSNKVCRDSTQSKTPALQLQIIDSLIYTSEEHNELVHLSDKNEQDPVGPR